MRGNKLRELLKEGKPTLGTGVVCPWPGIVELLGRTGVYDYVEFEGEYMPWDLHDLENLSRAVELFDMSSMMKVDQEPRTFIAQRSLGAGIQNILFADVRTAEDAQECVRIVKLETPKKGGIHGCHARRSVGYHIEAGTKAYAQAIDDVVIAFMIEKQEAVDELEEILSVEGLDMIQVGPCDLSISMGMPGQSSHPKVKEAELGIIRTAVAMGIRPRVELGFDYSLDEIRGYMDLGVIDFNLGVDVEIVYPWWKRHGESVKNLLAKS
jgi:2-keto-3-deoxy-L-rhamnonate aldolase RhmA